MSKNPYAARRERYWLLFATLKSSVGLEAMPAPVSVTLKPMKSLPASARTTAHCDTPAPIGAIGPSMAPVIARLLSADCETMDHDGVPDSALVASGSNG